MQPESSCLAAKCRCVDYPHIRAIVQQHGMAKSVRIAARTDSLFSLTAVALISGRRGLRAVRGCDGDLPRVPVESMPGAAFAALRDTQAASIPSRGIRSSASCRAALTGPRTRLRSLAGYALTPAAVVPTPAGFMPDSRPHSLVRWA